MLKTGVYVAKNHDGSYLDRYRVTIEVKETEHSHILKLIEFDSRYAASHISSMFGGKSRIVLRKPDCKHSVRVWNETSFTLYPYRCGVPYLFEWTACKHKQGGSQ